MIIIVNRSVPLNGKDLKKGLNTVNCDHRDPATINQLRIYRSMGAISFTETLPGDELIVDEKGAPVLDKKGHPQNCLCHHAPEYVAGAKANKARNDKRRKAMAVKMKEIKDMTPERREAASKKRLKKLADVKARRNSPQA